MRKFTKSILALAMCFVGVSYVHADEEVALTADMFKNWDGYGADAISTGTATVDFNIGNDATINAGGMVCGTGSVDYLIYADLTGSTKLVIAGDKGLQLRVLMNRQESNSGPLVEKKITIADDGTVELSLTDQTYVHINAIKLGWESPAGKVSSIKMVKPSDPLAINKEALKDVIAQAKLRKATGKTAASFAALTSAISDAETALAAAESASALDGAKDALLAAIDGLKLQDGYTNLTAAMFKQYTSLETPGVGSAVSGNYHLFEASDIPYGDNNVSELKWADLGCYDKLIITTSGDVKPRLCMNRLVANGQQAEAQADSKMLDINPNNDYTWSTGKYQTIDGNVYTISLASIKDDYSFARLHCIKKQGWGAGAFVSDLLLYRTLSVGSNLYATFGCTDKAAKLNGVTAYAAKYAAGKLTLTEVTNVPAGKGVVAVAAAAGYYAPTFDVAADDIDTDLKVSDGNVAGDGSSIYVLAKGTSGVGFYLLKSGDKVPAGKVYLEVAGGAPEFIGFAGAETTGIKNVNAQQTNTVVYNLNGQRVNKAQKGINIVNGKKFIVR